MIKCRIDLCVCLFVLVTVYGLSAPASAVEYSDFPPDLQLILDERIAELNAEGGICIAGRVTFSDGAPIIGGEDVRVNLLHGIDAPMCVYEDGWFIMPRNRSSYYAGSGKGFVLRAFGYDPIDDSITILDGEMTYLEYVMIKTPLEDLATVTGIVVDENNQPFNGARVRISFPLAYTCGIPSMSMYTGPDGRYEFQGLSGANHSLYASASKYAYHYAQFIPPAGSVVVQDRKLYPHRRTVIDYVYQADGSHSFTTGDLQTGTVEWFNSDDGMDFSEGTVIDPVYPPDLETRQVQDVLSFDNSYGNGRNGFYDAGAVDYDSVTEAAITGYTMSMKPCVVGHVYVVRTYIEDHYAKFIVKSNERSFGTVVPGNFDTIEFPDYAFTIDFTSCSGSGKVYVSKWFTPPAALSFLPYYFDISGLDGLTFSADLSLVYDDADVASLGLIETNLALLRSFDNGATWEVLDTQVDPIANTLHTQEINSFGCLLAIADGYDTDGDSVPNGNDNCPMNANPDQLDMDTDGLGDVCDVCPNDSDNDIDSDGICGDVDICPNDPDNDSDEDGFCADLDNCPTNTNPDQADSDGDGVGDVCDICPYDPDNDADSDGICGDVDNCPDVANPLQGDLDDDGAGDLCDTDIDGDRILNEQDNCPMNANVDQADLDNDSVGDVCDACQGTLPGIEVDLDGCPLVSVPADFDRDGDVDLVDFAHIQVCFSGYNPQLDPDCLDARLDDNSNVDEADLNLFLGCMSGSNVPADLNCMN